MILYIVDGILSVLRLIKAPTFDAIFKCNLWNFDHNMMFWITNRLVPQIEYISKLFTNDSISLLYDSEHTVCAEKDMLIVFNSIILQW